MARIRYIKPGFFTNEALADCQPLARLLFSGLWVIADREGRLEDRPRKIKIEILPYDNCDVSELVSELENAEMLQRYTVDGKSYIQITNFVKHQNPHPKEPASTIPAMNGTLTPLPSPENKDKPVAAQEQETTGNGRAKPENVKTFLNTEKNVSPSLATGEQCRNGNFNGDGEGTGRDAPPVNPLLQAFADVCRKTLDRLNEFQVRRMAEAMNALRALTEQPDEVLAPRVRRFGDWFGTLGFKDPTPSFKQVVDEWQRFEAAEREQKPAKAKAPISTVPENERKIAQQRRLERDAKLQQRAS